MKHQKSVEHIGKIINMFYGFGDEALTIGFNHNDEFALRILAVNFHITQLAHLLFHCEQMLWQGVNHQAGNVYFVQ
ncbi:Uncharacterised protein [Vibrio cholerae]|nr:Uncharacterised protein [Vibrio cholerae]